MAKTLQDFFGQSAAYDDNGNIVFNPFDIFGEVANINGQFPAGDGSDVNQVVAALFYVWFHQNYQDEQTGTRLSQDKTVPIATLSETPRRSLITRGGESQVKHDFSFSVYAKDSSEFRPTGIIGSESQGDGSPLGGGSGE